MTNLTLERQQSDVQWCSVPLHWSFDSEINSQPIANNWVRLLELLNPFCHEEALLLCQHSESEWVAWIPDHGEAILHISQFCLNPTNG